MLEVPVWIQLLYLLPSILQMSIIWHICLLFKILLQNIDAMKIENDVDVESEGDPTAVNTVEVYIPSVKVESEVSFVFRWFCYSAGSYACVCVCMHVYYSCSVSSDIHFLFWRILSCGIDAL
jgi:hypothetical protein